MRCPECKRTIKEVTIYQTICRSGTYDKKTGAIKENDDISVIGDTEYECECGENLTSLIG